MCGFDCVLKAGVGLLAVCCGFGVFRLAWCGVLRFGWWFLGGLRSGFLVGWVGVGCLSAGV